MIYVLVFLHFISTDRLQYYQIGTYSDKEQCLEQAEIAADPVSPDVAPKTAIFLSLF